MTLSPSADSWKPRSYQKAGVKLMVSQACAGLLYKPGLGKTSVAYMAIRILQDKQFVQKTLVICPIRPMYRVWPNQKDRYKEFAGLRVGVMHGADKEEVLASDDYDVYVINPEGLSWLFNAKVVKGKVQLDPVRMKWLKERFQMLVVDESTKFRNSQTQRFKLLRAFVPHFKRRYILTGTPTPKSLQDLFGQVYILDEGSSLGRYITHYRTSYFYPLGYGGYDWTPQPGAMERVTEKIANLVQVVEAKGNIELPEIVYNDIWIDLPPAARLRYHTMENDMVAALGEGTIVAANAAVASSKCRQIANGCVFSSENTGQWTEVHDEKITALEDLLEQLQGAPCLVTYEFTFDRARIEERMKLPCISTGNAKKDDKMIEMFSRGLLPAVIGQPQSISLGIDGLQDNCCDIAMVGVTWNLLDYEQVIERVRRSGNKSKTVTVHRIMARDTVDERIIAVLDSRDRNQNAIMKMLKEMRK
jgi:hypothetical protein